MLYAQRIAEGLILCEDRSGGRVKLTPDMCDGEIKEGDVLIKRGDKYRPSRRLTDKRRKELAALQRELFGKK